MNERTRPWRRTPPRPAWLDVAGPQGLDGHPLDAVDRSVAPLDLVLSERLLTPVVADDDLPLADAAGIAAHATQLLSHYHGTAALAWPVAPWTLREGARRRSGAWALSAPDVWAALPQPLRSARPAAWAALAACRAADPAWAEAPHAALAWIEPGLLCWLVLEAGVPQTVRHLRLPSSTPEALAERLQPLRAALPPGTETWMTGYGLSSPWRAAGPSLRCPDPLEASHPPAWLWDGVPAPAPGGGDFLPPARPLARWRWPLLGVALLCLGLAAQEAHDARAAVEETRETLARLQSRQAGLAVPPRAPMAAGATRAGDARASTVVRPSLVVARQALQHPWQGVLMQIEAAALDAQGRPHVAWLALDLQASRREVRLEGQAENRAQILAVSEALARLPGWTDVLPGAIQPEDGGRPGLRFTLQARVAPEGVRP
jgi:hypothetical protein